MLPPCTGRGRTEDIKGLIHRERLSIPDLAERVVFKDMMEGVFLALFEKNEEMYRSLEEAMRIDGITMR